MTAPSPGRGGGASRARTALAPLFPVDPSPHLVSPERRWRCLAAVTFLGVTGMTLLRLPDGLALDTLWAEDGAVFLHDAARDGPVRPLLRTYEGYIQVVPRVVLGAVSLLPVAWWAAGCATAAAAGVAAVVLFVYRAAAAHLPSPSVRAGLAGMIALVPVAGYEVLASMANLHWYLHVASFWALLWRPASRPALLSGAAVCFATAATDGLAVVLLPLALVRLVALRDGWQGAPSVGLLVGLCLQAAMWLQGPGLTAALRPPLGDAARTYAVRVVLAALAGDELAGRAFAAARWVAPLAAASAMVALAVAGRRRLARRAHLVVAVLAVQAGFFGLPVVLRWSPVLVPSPGADLHFGSRFMLVPIVLLWTAGAVLLDGGPPRRPGVVVPRVLAALLLLPAVTADFSAEGPRLGGPRWSAGLEAAASSCPPRAWRDVPIAPDNGRWKVAVPCRRLPRAEAGAAPSVGGS